MCLPEIHPYCWKQLEFIFIFFNFMFSLISRYMLIYHYCISGWIGSFYLIFTFFAFNFVWSTPRLGSSPEGIGYPLQYPWVSLVAQMVKWAPRGSCNAGDPGSVPGSGRYPGGGKHGNPLQYSCLENSHRQRSLAGYSPWGGKEPDMTKRLSRACSQLTMLWHF